MVAHPSSVKPSGLVASVGLVPLGLVATLALAYGLDIAYLIALSRLGRRNPRGRSS